MVTLPRSALVSLLLAGSMLFVACMGSADAAHRSPTRQLHRASASSASDLLFTGDHISDFPFNQSAPGAVTEVPDPAGGEETALQMTVDNNDVAPITPTDSPRAQLTTPTTIEAGDEFWWSGKFFLPSSFPSKVPGWLNIIEGAYGAPFDGTPPFEIEVVGDKLRWERNGTYDWDVPWEMPLVRGEWVTYLVHQKFAADGFVELWINGEQVNFFENSSYNPNDEGTTQRLEMATRDHSNDGGANFLVLQSYRKADMFNSLTLYQGATRVGPTRGSVEGSAPRPVILRHGETLRSGTKPQSSRRVRLGLAQRTGTPEALARVR